MTSGVGAVGSGFCGIPDELRIRYTALNKKLKAKRLGLTESVYNVPSVSFSDILAQTISENTQSKLVSLESIKREPISIAYKRLLSYL